MRILAIESATEEPSVAVVSGEGVLALRPASRDARRSETLLPAIVHVLDEAGLALADLHGFAIAIGPGSFTGLRVGLATLKGIAFGDDRPAAGVPTLDALMLQAGEPRPAPVVAALDARRGEVYAQVFAEGAGEEPLVPEGLYRPEALGALLPEGLGKGILVGDGARVLAGTLGPAFEALPVGPSAAQVGALGLRSLRAGQGIPARELTPYYGRRAQAEVERTGSATEAR